MQKINFKDHEEWLGLKKKFVGGSEISYITGFNKYGSGMSVFIDKTTDEIIEYDNDFMWWGREIEPIVAKKFALETGKKVINDNHILIDDEYPFMGANIDRRIVGEKAILECKTTNSMNKAEWEDKKIPMAYYCQLQWYLGITGYQKAYIACLLGDKTFIWKECGRDEKFIQDLRECCIDFWNNYILTKTPPPAVGGDENYINQLYPNLEDAVDLSDHLETFNARSLVEEKINELKEQLKPLESALKDYNANIKQLMENKTQGYCGIYAASNKVTTQKRVDTDKLKKEYPDIYEKVIKESYVNRFSVKEMKDIKGE